MKGSYAVLHAHDTYGSIGDSILYIKDYVEKAKSLGIQCLALTNHGSLSTFVEFYETCKENKIKPIIGCEFYYVQNISSKDKKEKRNHLILLAKNDIGLTNLIKLHNIATEKGFYYRPRIDFSLVKEHHEGLICLSACVSGSIPCAILNDDLDFAKKQIEQFKTVFGDDFYLELQPGIFSEQKKVNHWLCVLASQCKVPYVVTNDIHYLNKDEWNIHDAHVKDSRKQSLDSPMIYPDVCYYLMSREELKESLIQALDFANAEEIAEYALNQTLMIADKVTTQLSSKIIMPCYDNTINQHQLLVELCYQRLDKIINRLVDPSAYETRLEHELDVIHALGFDGYFLIVKDIIDYCDQNDIARGPGRGSVVGSLVSYLLNISKIDPIEYGLLFERFLSKERSGFPDADLDLIPNRRDEVYNHIIERYGIDHCCFVSTFNKRKARAAIKTAARILNYSVEIGDALSKAIPYVIYEDEEKYTDPTIEKVIESNSVFAQMAKQYPDIVDLAKKLQGYPSSMGIHPAGIVISPVPVTDRYPLIRAKDKILHATSLSLKDVEKLSGVKIDLLSLANLTIIDAVEKWANIKIDYETPEFFNDEDVWDMIGSSNTTGLFQISSSLYRSRMPQLKPRSIPELAACLALVRGPCISSGADKKYIRILQGKETPDPICNEYWNITKKTCGIIIYQEQVLKICQAIGMDSEDSYRLLKACSKKKEKQIAIYKNVFFQNALNKNINENDILHIWNEILNSAKYAFNVAHATAYAFLCYASAFLKIHNRAAYMCELLNKAYEKSDTVMIRTVVYECIQLNIAFLPLDINQSQWNFILSADNTIRIGFVAVKGFGEKAYEAMYAAQKPFTSLPDFINRVPGRQCNKKCVSLLILSGAFNTVSEQAPVELLKTYLHDIRKEEYENTIKIGKEEICLTHNFNEIELQLLGAHFPRKEKAA